MNIIQLNRLQLACSLILFAAGLLILINSLDMANGVMSEMMTKNGGSTMCGFIIQQETFNAIIIDYHDLVSLAAICRADTYARLMGQDDIAVIHAKASNIKRRAGGNLFQSSAFAVEYV